MALRRTARTVVVGDPLRLDGAQGEDRLLVLTFVEPPDSPSAGQRTDVTGTAKMRLRGPRGWSGALGGSLVSSGVLAFLVGATMTASHAPQLAAADVVVVSVEGSRTQILVRSTYEITRSPAL